MVTHDPRWAEVAGLSATNFAFVELRNISSKNIRGYTLQIVITDPTDGKVIQKRAQTMNFDVINGNPRFVSPGTRWPHPRAIPMPPTVSGIAPKCDVIIDYIVFDDGTVWGPHKLLSSDEIRKMMVDKKAK